MSKPVKEMIMSDYQQRFAEVDSALVIDIRGIDANENNTLRNTLREKGIKVTIIKNTLARKSFAGTGLEALAPGLEGPSALAYGDVSVVNIARELVDWAKKVQNLELKGAVLEGIYFEGEAGVKRLSEFPTKEEAQGKVVQLVLTPAQNVVGAVAGPGSTVLSLIKQIEEKLEKGETIAKAG